MTTQLTTKTASKILLIVLITVYWGATGAGACAKAGSNKGKIAIPSVRPPWSWRTSNGGNSINDQTWVSGYSRLPNRNRHATLWRNSSLTDLFTLGDQTAVSPGT